MLCPTDGATLVMTERSGVEIDYCPKCRGVWLDRGELDKIIERSAGTPREAAPVNAAPPERAFQPASPRRDHDDDDHDDRYSKKRRGGFLGELFDF